MVTVCNGDQLELMCTITDSIDTSRLLEWSFNLIPANATSYRIYNRVISSSSISNQTRHIIVNSTTFTFSRVSAPNGFPLISKLLISPVSNSLNGTLVNCMDISTSETATVLVIIFNVMSNGALIHGISYTEQY